MKINLIKNKFLYHLKKLASFPKEKISNLLSVKYSNVHLLTDGASWATDKTTNDNFVFFKKFNIGSTICYYPPKNQYVYYVDQFSILKNNFHKRGNIVALDYQHGLTKYIKNDKLLKFIKNNQDNIRLIRVTNSFFKSYLINKGIKKNKIFQIPLEVDTKKFKQLNKKKYLKKKFNLPNNKILIGSFHKDGNGWEEGLNPKIVKGPDIFIKTLKELAKKIDKENIFVVLTSPARGYIKKELKKNKIKFKHFYPLEDSQIPLLYNCLDLYLVTSRDEGGPRGILEAMATGVPVISTKVGMAHDNIKNGYNGFKTPIEDYKSLSKFMLKIIKNKNLRKKIIKNGLKTAKLNNYNNHIHLWMKFKNFFINNKFTNKS